MDSDMQVPGDYRILKQAAFEKGTAYDALRLYVWFHGISKKHVGRSIVVRMCDLVGYVPRGARHVVGA